MTLTDFYKYLLFVSLSLTLVFSCASVQKPSGGEKDVLAPVLIESRPSHGETRVSPKVISLVFDEYFTLNNIQSELLISPPLDSQPLISQKGKKIFIELQTKLKENTTYTFNFGKAIADFHEGNVLRDFSLVFSTGAIIDSLNVRGSILPCPSNEIPENTIIALYKRDSLALDSTIYLQKPNYFGTVDKHGHFNITNLKEGTFEIIALEDVNGNYQYDVASEQIAFYNTLINSADSSQILLWLFKEKGELKLIDKKLGIPTTLTFNQSINSEEINISNHNSVYSKLSDSKLDLWPVLKDGDSLITTVFVKNICDTINFDRSEKTSIEKPILSIDSEYVSEGEFITVHCTDPIKAIDTSKVYIYADSTLIPYSYSQSDFTININIPYLGNQTYKLIIGENALSTIYNLHNDSTVISFYSKSQHELAGLEIDLDGLASESYYIELLNGEKVIQRKVKGEHLTFDKLLPAEYRLRLVIDSNNDGKWTAGSYLNKEAPEQVYYYPEKLKLRANWDLELDWNPLIQSP